MGSFAFYGRAEVYLAEAEVKGMVRPAADPTTRAQIAILRSHGLLVLHQHTPRLAGIDLIDLIGLSQEADHSQEQESR